MAWGEAGAAAEGVDWPLPAAAIEGEGGPEAGVNAEAIGATGNAGNGQPLAFGCGCC